jgi:hypothetical protein
MTRSPRRLRRAGLLVSMALAAAVPASAQAATVASGQLDWTQTAVYNSGTPQRTWLGYVTGPGPSLAAGSATPIAPATGPTVTTASDRGVGQAYTTTFPATTGTYDPNNGVGALELDGGLSFVAPPPPAGHGFTITVTQPRLVLDGDHGQLFASGQGSTSAGAVTYDRSKPLFNLDLTNATVTLKANGSRVLSGIVPSLATGDYAFPANYLAGAGPDRDPNTFGAFAVTLRLAPGDATGPAGASGAQGPTGSAGARGPAGATATIRRLVAVLATAPFRGSATRKVSVRSAKGKVLATGTVRGRVLKVTLAQAVTALSGKLTLKVNGATTTVRIPS